MRYEIYKAWMALPKEANLFIIVFVMVVFTAVAKAQTEKK